jgi:hypothetical protein
MAKANIRTVSTFVGDRNTGKTTSVKLMVDNFPEDVFIYSTPGDKTFNRYLRQVRTIEAFKAAWEMAKAHRYEMPLPQPGAMTGFYKGGRNGKGDYDLFPEPVALRIAGGVLSGYIQGWTSDGQNLVLLVNCELDQITVGSMAFALPPNRTLKQRVEDLAPVFIPLSAIQACKRLVKIQVPKNMVEFHTASTRTPTISRFFPEMMNMMFVIADASSLLAEDRVYNRALHNVVTECRHQGVTLQLIVHKLDNLQEEQFAQSNYVVLHKQRVPPVIPSHLKDTLTEDKKRELIGIIERVEGHASDFYNETFTKFPPGEGVEVADDYF